MDELEDLIKEQAYDLLLGDMQYPEHKNMYSLNVSFGEHQEMGDLFNQDGSPNWTLRTRTHPDYQRRVRTGRRGVHKCGHDIALRAKDYRGRSYCKGCKKEQSQAWYKRNPDYSRRKAEERRRWADIPPRRFCQHSNRKVDRNGNTYCNACRRLRCIEVKQRKA